MNNILKTIIAPLALMFLALLSCSSEKGYPYTMLEGAPRPTRIYTLHGGTKVFVTPEEEQPRTIAALCLPGATTDSLARLCTTAPFATNYPLLLASIGTVQPHITTLQGTLAVFNNIPSNETENWASIIQGTFAALPDSAFFVIIGGADCNAAVAHIDKAFAATPRTSSHSGITGRETGIITALATQPQGSPLATHIVDANDSTPATSNIKLQPSPPYVLTFPDESKIKKTTENSVTTFFCAEAHCALAQYHLNGIPVPMVAMAAEYINSAIGNNTATADGNYIQLRCNNAKSKEEATAFFKSMLDTIARGERFNAYLDSHKEAAKSRKQSYANIASQTAHYLAPRQQMPCGRQEIATYCMNALRQSTTETAPLPLFDDAAATHYLLPQDKDTIVTIIATEPYSGIEEQTAAMIFNKAVTLTGAPAHSAHHTDGAYMHIGDNPSALPFTRSEYEAARNYMLYECSTRKLAGSALVAESAAAHRRGYTATELYDALSALSFSDIEDFHAIKCEKPKATFIVGRLSNVNQRELSKQGTMVHITYDELFGY